MSNLDSYYKAKLEGLHLFGYKAYTGLFSFKIRREHFLIFAIAYILFQYFGIMGYIYMYMGNGFETELTGWYTMRLFSVYIELSMYIIKYTLMYSFIKTSDRTTLIKMIALISIIFDTFVLINIALYHLSIIDGFIMIPFVHILSIYSMISPLLLFIFSKKRMVGMD